MPLHSLTQIEMNNHCRRILESLETWLRRLIHEQLYTNYGNDYINAQRTNGEYILNKKIRQNLNSKLKAQPDQFSRPIDAATLEIEISIVCNPLLFEEFFSTAFATSFPEGCAEARTFLNRIVAPRNKLAHANPISVRQAEQVICYSGDIIDSLKHYYEENGMAKHYNVPTIIRVTDSFGGVFNDSKIRRNNTGRGHVNRQEDNSIQLRPGEKLSIEIEVDPVFDPNDYDITWTVAHMDTSQEVSSKFVIEINEAQVREDFTVYVKVTSKKTWHRLGDCDDCIGLTYRILPPVE